MNESFLVIDNIYENENARRSGNLKSRGLFFTEDNSQLLQRFVLELRQVLKGLENLKITYKNDILTHTVSMLILYDRSI